jgi:toxin FitB
VQLVDTNVLSELIRQKPNPGVLLWLQESQRTSPSLIVSAVSVDEIAFGVARRPSPKLLAWFDQFMSIHTIVPVTGDVARRAGELRAIFEGRGQQRSQADMLIAATAQSGGLTLVTRNVTDFENCGVALLNPFSET